MQYIQSEAWQQKRQQRLRADGYRCQACGSRQRLEVNHLTYDRLGAEWVSDLETLCHRCHAAYTKRARANRRDHSSPRGVWVIIEKVRWIIFAMALVYVFFVFLG